MNIAAGRPYYIEYVCLCTFLRVKMFYFVSMLLQTFYGFASNRCWPKHCVVLVTLVEASRIDTAGIFYTPSSKGSQGLKTKVKNVAGMTIGPGNRC